MVWDLIHREHEVMLLTTDDNVNNSVDLYVTFLSRRRSHTLEQRLKTGGLKEF